MTRAAGVRSTSGDAVVHAGRPQAVTTTGWVRFVHRYGWRAYALPVLTLVTIGALTTNGAAAPSRGDDRPAAQSAPAPTAGSDPTTASSRVSSPAPVDSGAALHRPDAGFRAGSTPAPVVIHLKSDATSCATNTSTQLILVSISSQHLWACEGARQVTDSPVTTGKVVDRDQTPLGSWRVQAKQRDRYLTGPGYRDYVKYWMPFNGDFGLHDASWQTMPFGSKDWRTRGSHGCVHTPTATMAWIYRWAQPGKTVVTIER